MYVVPFSRLETERPENSLRNDARTVKGACRSPRISDAEADRKSARHVRGAAGEEGVRGGLQEDGCAAEIGEVKAHARAQYRPRRRNAEHRTDEHRDGDAGRSDRAPQPSFGP